MSRIVIAGHSVNHPRQEALSLELARLGHEVLALGPRQWNDEAYEPMQHGNYTRSPLNVLGGGIFNFTFEGMEQAIQNFGPDLLYLQQEGFSRLAYEVSALCQDRRLPLVLFSWENRPSVGQEARGMEKKVLESCAGIVAGNTLAKQRMEGIAGHPLKVLVCPQTGIRMDHFRPMPDIPKEYDLVYQGRFDRAKGISFIEQACQTLGRKLLIVGGRGNYAPKHYAHIEPSWMPDSELPKWINKAKVSAVASWSYSNYCEQWPSSPGDGAACGLQVLVTDNGSIPEHYGSAPFYHARQADQEDITRGIKDLLDNPRPGGRDWTEKHMSVQATATKVDKFFREVLGA